MLRKRLWQGGTGMFVLIATLVIGNYFSPPEKSVTSKEVGHDFLAFYTAGTFLRTGRSAELYDLGAVREFQHALAAREGLIIGKSFGPWWNPPFYALAFAPLSALPYSKAATVWRWINVGCLAAAIVLLCRMLVARSAGGLSAGEAYELRLTRQDTPASDWRDWGLVPLLIVVSSPFLQAISHGQNTFTSLLIVVATAAAWRARRGVLAGLLGGLLFYKPQLAAVVALVMVCDMGWAALAGLAMTGVALLAVNVVALPGTLADYSHRLAANVHYMQVENMYLWERHVTLKAFWRLLLQGREAGEAIGRVMMLTWVTAATLGAGLVIAAVVARVREGRVLRERGSAPGARLPQATDRLIAATVAVMPLMMPFYFDYDLLLLALPAVLFAREIRMRGHGSEARLMTGVEKVVTGGWIVLFLGLLVNAHVGLLTHVNGAVPLLSVIAGLLVWRVGVGVRVSGVVIKAETESLRKAA